MWAVDLFADRDLARVAKCVVCPADVYPDAIPALASQFPPGPVLYTGGLENHPRVVAELAAQRELWGNTPDVLERVRDPFVLFPTLADAGFTVPRLVPRGAPCPTEGRWLRKPLLSGGGRGIRFARPGEAASAHHYFQEFIDGAPMSAQFVSDPTAAHPWETTALNGITEQLLGEPWLHAAPFAYCGNIGPVELPQLLAATLWTSGLRLNQTVAMRGLWGLDFVLQGETVYPVEVNPRYTAAIEVLELSWHVSLLWTHCRCFTSSHALAKYKSWQRWDAPVGKAVYYAPYDFRFPAAGPWDADLTSPFDPWRVPDFADIPEAGAAIARGHPVLTFFATGSTPTEVRERLQSRAAELDRLFTEAQP
ncbi:MAG: ATP-grasp domain-containing protein [Planctomycetes bacterium]|nr:ATP-grasp domain-containing protein [Planctomycetota bacterium]